MLLSDPLDKNLKLDQYLTHDHENSTSNEYTSAILATNLTKHVGEGANTIEILNNLNLQVLNGESLAIIGSSGSGKSTLLALLAGLDVPTSGTVKVRGMDFSALDEDARAAERGKRMGFVFQSFQLLGTMTALENEIGRASCRERVCLAV